MTPNPRIGSLFSGSGMLDEGVRAVLGGSMAWHAEIDPAASKVLAYRYPDVPNLGDISAVDWATVPPVDVITGGSPCQDVSHAGKRAGMRAGTRSGLWARMCDAIEAIRPSVVVWENVRGVLSAEADSALEPCPGCVGDGDDGAVLRALGRVLGDLADLGYDTGWHGLRAADVGAPHGRFRVFVVATDAERGGRAGRASDAGRRAVGRTAATRPSAGAAPNTGSGSLARPAATRDRLRLAAERGDGSTTYADEPRLEGRRLCGCGCAVERATWQGRPKALVQIDQFDDRPTRDGVADGVGVGCPVAIDEHCADALQGSADSGLNVGERSIGGCRGEHGEGGHGSNAPSRHQEVNTPAEPVSWGQYEAAIRRWERLTRPAPSPTETSAKGGQRLAPRFTEWMQGWPDGWVTDVPGITRNDALKICGNGVVPQQAAEALRRLLPHLAACAA